MDAFEQSDKDLADMYCSTCSNAFDKILRDGGLVQPLSRTILVGRIRYDSRFDVRDHHAALVAGLQADIPDRESRITGLFVTYETFFYQVVESSDESLSDIVLATFDAVRERTILEAKVVRTGGIANRLFNEYNACVVRTPRFVENDSDYTCRGRRSSCFVEDSLRRTSRLIEDGNRQNSCFNEDSNRRTSRFNKDSHRRTSRSADEGNRRKSRFDEDSNRRTSHSAEDSNRRKSRLNEDGNGRASNFVGEINRRTSRCIQGSNRRTSSFNKDGSQRVSSFDEDSNRRASGLNKDGNRRISHSAEDSYRRKSRFHEDGNRRTSRFAEDNNRRKSRFSEDNSRRRTISFAEDSDNDESDIPTIVRVLKKLDEAVFVLASCIRFVRPEEVEARVNELLPTGVLLSRDELADLLKERYFLTVEEHVQRYLLPVDYTSFLEEEWPPTGPAHDPSYFLDEIDRFERQVDQSLLLEEERKKAKSNGLR